MAEIPHSSIVTLAEHPDGDGSRGIVRDVDTGETIVRMLSFRGLGHVRIVIEAELQRDGFTLHYEEAVAWREALTDMLGEIDAWRADPDKIDHNEES